MLYWYSHLQGYILVSPLIRTFTVADSITAPLSANEDSTVGLPQVSEASCKTNLSLEDLKYTDEELQDPALLRRRLTVETITKDDKSARFYTGISHLHFNFELEVDWYSTVSHWLSLISHSTACFLSLGHLWIYILFLSKIVQLIIFELLK